jgi:hypothetical protein
VPDEDQVKQEGTNRVDADGIMLENFPTKFIPVTTLPTQKQKKVSFTLIKNAEDLYK